MSIGKKQALEEAYEQWTMMAETGDDDKFTQDGPWIEYSNCCSLCEYTKGILGADEGDIDECDFCPVLWVVRGTNHCCHKDSPYKAWCNAKDRAERKNAAARVAKLMKESLDRLFPGDYIVR